MTEGRRIPYFYAPRERSSLEIIDRTPMTESVLRTAGGKRYIHSGNNPDARRNTDRIDAVILHHTTFESSGLDRFNTTIANYVVLRDGRVLKLRELEVAMNSVGTDQHAIDIEFEGDYPGARVVRRARRAARRDEPGPSVSLHDRFARLGQLPPEPQIQAGRALVRRLRARHGVQYVFAHSQFKNKNCPGPHLWYNVGEWAVRTLSMRSDGRGNSIPTEFRDHSLAIPPWPLRRPSSPRSTVGAPRNSGPVSGPSRGTRVPGRIR